jgi:hypothetical protein
LVDAPPEPFNLTSPQIYSVREGALQFGELLKRRVNLVGHEADSALLGNPARLCALLGQPATPLGTVMRWIAHWIQHRGRLLGKPTHYEVRDGSY